LVPDEKPDSFPDLSGARPPVWGLYPIRFRKIRTYPSLADLEKQLIYPALADLGKQLIYPALADLEKQLIYPALADLGKVIVHGLKSSVKVAHTLGFLWFRLTPTPA
jgi:hypothetical protein